MYAPPIIPRINFLFALNVISILHLLRYRRSFVQKCAFGNRIFVDYVICATFTMMYIIINSGLGIFVDFTDYSQMITMLYRWGLLFGSSIICSLYALVYRKAHSITKNHFVECILYASVGQTIIDVLMATIPRFKSFVLTLAYSTTGDSLIQNEWQVERRYNAFANNVLDTFGLCSAITAILAFYLAATTKKAVYYAFFVILLIPSALNSRTGLVLSFVGAALALPYVLQGKQIVKSISYIIVGIGAILLIWNVLPVISPITAQWVESGITSVLEVLGGESNRTDSMDKLFSSRFWLMPTAQYWIFGTGHNRYTVTGYPHTDVGYINDFWFGGLIGIAIQYMPFVYLAISARKATIQSMWKGLPIILFIILAIFNVKGIVTSANGGMLLYIMVLLILSEKESCITE